jgi:hypothetical protein
MYYAARVRYHLNATTHLISVREVCSPLFGSSSIAPVGNTSLDMVHKVASEHWQSTVAGFLEEVMQEQLQAIVVLTKAGRTEALRTTSSSDPVVDMMI